MEVQLTDDENAAFAILSSILVRILYHPEYKVNFYIPIDKVDENMKRANMRDAVT
jgi:glutamate--cysteine ligase catalytic subunit